MKKIPAAPSNLARWIDRNVMPHYLFYSYDRNQPETQVSCTYCEKFSVIKKPKTGKIFVCPQCKQKAIAKAQGEEPPTMRTGKPARLFKKSAMKNC